MSFKNLDTDTAKVWEAGQSTEKVFCGRISGVGANTIEMTAGGDITAATVATTGAMTSTGGVRGPVAITAATSPKHVNDAPPPTLTTGTDTTPVSGTVYAGQVELPSNRTLTGVGFLIGSVGGTNKVIVSLYDSTGALVANSPTSGTDPTVGSSGGYQEVAFTATYAAKGPGVYYVGVSVNGNTCRLRLQVLNGGRGIALAGSYGTLASVTPPTTGAVAAPIAYVY